MNSPFEHRPAGLFFQPGGFYIDPRRGVDLAVISHGHADHANPYNRQVWCTRGTRKIMEHRYGVKLKNRFEEQEYHQPFRINDITLHFVPAGHILGSAQIVIDFDGKRYCYTGDFKLRKDPTCLPFEPVACDVLITETTFAVPGYEHPAEEEEFGKLEPYSGFNVVIGAYSLGKAQRLTRLLNHYLPERPVMVHPGPALFHKLYENEGFSTGDWNHYNFRLFQRTRGNILVVPPNAMSTFYRSPDTVTTFATGWKKSPWRSHFNFYLSDHADWNEVLEVVRLTGAKELITVHGDGSHLKSYFEKHVQNINVMN